MIQSWKLGLATLVMSGAITSLSFANTWANCAYAQVIPDNTLGNENSTVKSTGSVDSINGGATRGANLFHSFGEFNVGEGRSVYFTNPTGIENILSRVTGGNPSQILGKLGVLGNANLFLINPNGIIFGQNASLDVKGSFVGTTANGIGLTNGDIFSTNPQAPLPTKLLNVNPNALLFNQLKTQEIVNRSTADSRGLQVPQGKSLLLVGGNVSLEGGKIFAPGGRVELGSVAGSGTVGLNVDNSDLRLNFPDGLPRADVFLNNGADVNVRASGGGSIAVNAQNLNLAGESRLRAGIGSGLGSVGSQAGDIEVNATGTINLTNNSLFTNRVVSGATGNSGNIRISTGELTLTKGAQLSTSTLGQGNAGNIIIDARDHVSLDGKGSDPNYSTAIFSSVDKTGIGKGGDIRISTRELSLTNGAQLVASTDGEGDAGNIIIDAHDRVSFDGRSSDGSSGSDAFSDVGRTGRGQGGEIRISTRSLSVTNGAQLLAITRGQGNAGNVNINAPDTVFLQGVGNNGFSSLIGVASINDTAGAAGKATVSTGSFRVADGAIVEAQTNNSKPGGSLTINADTFEATNGGQIITRTYNSGKAGNITLNITGSATLSGSDPTYDDRLTKFGDSRNGGSVSNLGAVSGLFANTDPNTEGFGGDIVINSGKLTLQGGAEIAVNSQGNGQGGKIDVQAGSLILKNQGQISAETFSTQGGEIGIKLRDILLLRQGSRISTNAGTGQKGGDGGNITINAPNGFIVAVPIEDSDITANAFQGRGGNINITAQGIYGLKYHSQLTPESDITASSQFGVNGVVDINTPGIEPNSGLINLPVQLVEARVAQTCQPSGNQAQSEFVVTGRGGLPPSPDETLSSDAVQVDWVTLNPKVENRNQGVSTNITTPEPDSILEATGWTIANNGNVILTASATPVLPGNSKQTPAKCHAK